MTAWDDLNAVLAAMDAPEPIRARTRQLLSYYEAMGYHDFDAFVSEALDDEGHRRFYSLWLFNPIASMEAALSEAGDDELDGVPLRGRVVRWVARSRDYDYAEATPDSRLYVQLWYTDVIYGDLYASGTNCDRLCDLLRRYVLPETGVTAGDPQSARVPQEAR